MNYSIDTKRHSLAHIMAQAVQQIFPGTKIATGPYTEDGFYYDFDFGETEFSEKDFKKIEKSMKKIISQNQDFKMFEVSYDEAREILRKMWEDFKIEIVDMLESGRFKNNEKITGKISFYINTWKWGKVSELQEFIQEKWYFDFSSHIDGDQVRNLKFIDMCAGPEHVLSTSFLDANSFKLVRVAGAYWMGNAENQQLTRIYAYAFENKDELDVYLKMLAEAKKRDHRVIGKKLELFTFSERVWSGLALFLPYGEMMKYELETWMREEKIKLGYSFVTIPHIAKKELYETSGHMGKYDAMMPTMTDKEWNQFVLKAMNCPHHFELYNATPHSYRQLPFRYAENTTCYRNEKTGELSGLTRVKALTQDDTHHFVRHDQIAGEVEMILGLMEKVYTTFGFNDFKVEISVRDSENKDKYFGDDEVWNKAESTLVEMVKKWWVEYSVEEWEAAFYGPKIDIKVKDAIGRDWQLTTVQLDFIQPENFDMTYTNEKGEDERPAVLHVAILGSSHRFMWVLIEHFAGTFPLWLAPRQVRLLSVADKFNNYAWEVYSRLRQEWIRVELDDSGDSLNKKIRNAEKMHVNYILVIGEDEVNSQSVAVRNYKTKEQSVMKIEEFSEMVRSEIKEKNL